MVDFIDARFGEPLDLAVVQNPERHGDGQRQLRFDFLDGGADALQQFFGRPAYGDDDAELTGAAGVRGARRRNEIRDARKRLRLDIGSVARALRAKVAVFRAAALFGVVQHFDGDLVAAIMRAHVVSER